MKYFFESILCKLPINMKSIFRIFPIVKDFPINLFSCWINSFVINDVCKNLKKNVNIKVKSKRQVVFRTLY